MKRISRRSFVKSAGTFAAAPALVSMQAHAQQGGFESIRRRFDAIEVEPDIVFGKGGDLDLLLDVYHPPAGTSKRMGVVHLFGGGFFTGSRTGVRSGAQALATQGYTSIATTYRLTGQGRWPDQIHDVKGTIRWVRANADRLGIDADKIAVAGYSAGGMLALFAAATNGRKEFEGTVGGNLDVSSDVQACIAYYPATSATQQLMPDGTSEADMPDAIAAASPGTYISANFAPTIFLQGVADRVIPIRSTLDFFNRLHDEGVTVDLHLFQGADHGFEIANLDAALVAGEAIDLFLDRVVVNPTEYPSFFGGGRGGGRGRGTGRGGGRGRGGPPPGA